jgi:hypothetical protein
VLHLGNPQVLLVDVFSRLFEVFGQVDQLGSLPQLLLQLHSLEGALHSHDDASIGASLQLLGAGQIPHSQAPGPQLLRKPRIGVGPIHSALPQKPLQNVPAGGARRHQKKDARSAHKPLHMGVSRLHHTHIKLRHRLKLQHNK